jgi:hypothetical protein
VGNLFILYQFKNGKLEIVDAQELVGIRTTRAWDRSLGTMVTYQL